MADNICPISMVSGNPTGCHLDCKLLDPEILLTLIDKKAKGEGIRKN